MHGLTHYTDKVEGVVNILRNGFAWIDNKRELIHKLVPSQDFSAREPQRSGMISFTDLAPPAPAEHLANFGRFGIVVSHEWARPQMAQPVLYIPDDGPIVDALRWLFATGYEQLLTGIKCSEDAAAQMASTNKAMAGVYGGLLWNNLLTVYEYMEPEDHACEAEWRIVHPHPVYGYSASKQEKIQRVSPPMAWYKCLGVLTVPEDAVIGFVCPRQDEQELVRDLPPNFSSKPRDLY